MGKKRAGGVLLSHGRCGSAAWREKGKGVRALLSPPALTPYSIAKSPSPCPALAFRSQLRASQARSASVPPPICFAPLRSPLRSRSTLGLSRSWSTTWLQSIAAGKTCLRGGLALRCFQRLSVPDIATGPAAGATTRTPWVRHSRSSRTRECSRQSSCAHRG